MAKRWDISEAMSWRARNFADTLTPAEAERWTQLRTERLLHGGGGGLTVDAFHEKLRALAETALPVTTSGLLNPGFSIDRLENELIYEALARASGNKTEAAKLLGITRRRLYSRLKSIEQGSDPEENPSESTDGTKPNPNPS